MIIDSHAHVYSEKYAEKQDLIIKRALESGVTKMVMPNINKDSLGRSILLAIKYPENLYPAIGIHPTEVKDSWKDDLKWMKENFYLYKWVAIGEIGLDYYWSKEYVDIQKKCFVKQMQWAINENLPIIIHSRDAMDDTISCIYEVNSSSDKKLKGVFHSFTGSCEDLHKALAVENFMIGINGVVTFKNSNLREFISVCPLERLLIETDAPYLAPVPYRGTVNEPSFIIKVAEELAKSYDTTTDEICRITKSNAEKLFVL